MKPSAHVRGVLSPRCSARNGPAMRLGCSGPMVLRSGLVWSCGRVRCGIGTSSMPLSSAVSVDLLHSLLPSMAGLVGKKHARARRTNARLPPRRPRACACVGSWARECARESALPALTLRASCVHFCIAALPLPVCSFVCLFVCRFFRSLLSLSFAPLSLSRSGYTTQTHTHTHTHRPPWFQPRRANLNPQKPALCHPMFLSPARTPGAASLSLARRERPPASSIPRQRWCPCPFPSLTPSLPSSPAVAGNAARRSVTERAARSSALQDSA